MQFLKQTAQYLWCRGRDPNSTPFAMLVVRGLCAIVIVLTAIAQPSYLLTIYTGAGRLWRLGGDSVGARMRLAYDLSSLDEALRYLHPHAGAAQTQENQYSSERVTSLQKQLARTRKRYAWLAGLAVVLGFLLNAYGQHTAATQLVRLRTRIIDFAQAHA